MSEEVKVEEEKVSIFQKVKTKAIEHKDKLVKVGLVVGGTVLGAIGVGALVNRSGIDYDEFDTYDAEDFIDLGMADDDADSEVVALEEAKETEKEDKKE